MNPAKNNTPAKTKAAFGDFQTPLPLAREVCNLLLREKIQFRSIIEPNCGTGSFLLAATEAFQSTDSFVGADINAEHLRTAKQKLNDVQVKNKVVLLNEDFFHFGWGKLLDSMPEPLLVIGNPPWVTNTELSVLRSHNTPRKSNFQNFKGLEALTGKSNFDISEWMLIKELEWISGRKRVLAMLCKISVARKALFHAWKQKLNLDIADIYPIDASKHFNVSVDACLLVARGEKKTNDSICRIHKSLKQYDSYTILSYTGKYLIADMNAFRRREELLGNSIYKWRSGIKHDCAKVMELTKQEDEYRNGFGEQVDIESTYLYPMLKGSQLANGLNENPDLWMLVTQHHPGEDTRLIRNDAPKTWAYLTKYRELLDQRSSSIYKNRPSFCIFGVGDYSFSAWKVAISGFYKNLNFKLVSPRESKPVVFDDTCYFIGCRSKEEAELLYRTYSSDIAKDFYSAFIFWDEKRPITISILQRLDVVKLSKQLVLDKKMALPKNSIEAYQMVLFP
jgi:methylase of polypeptide subunit release factors